ncbi:MAG: SufS family cysteine desulfurase [Gammaproteobacteria bacterium]|nr:SufS family cysteine desulfurase [Gammaproteobacteria bacterium]
MFDVAKVRSQFPILSREVNGKPLVYLDNAATTQKPQCVIDSLVEYYTQYNSNVHRGAHALADQATRSYEGARESIARFLNAQSSCEVIWTAGTTEGLNIIARGMSQQLDAGDEIIVSELEHHANLVPWQQACKYAGATLKIAPIDENGALDVDAFAALLTERTRLVSIAHISNALGTINPIKTLATLIKANRSDTLFVVDGAQGIAHGDVDVQALGCDFYAFSGHKVFGPTGVGVLWGKESILKDWPVWQTGGEMIQSVTYQDATWNVLPGRLEAGTPNIADAIALGTAIEWLATQDLEGMRLHEHALIERAHELSATIDGMRVFGRAPERIGVLSFTLSEGHPADVGFLLDKQGIAIRTGSHCAEPLMGRFGVTATARASFSIYNTLDDVDALFEGIKKAQRMLG